MSKQTIINLANKQLIRIGIDSDVEICLDRYGRIALSDCTGYYQCKNYRTLISDLQCFSDHTITDQFYDGSDYFVWSQIWDLFTT